MPVIADEVKQMLDELMQKEQALISNLSEVRKAISKERLRLVEQNYGAKPNAEPEPDFGGPVFHAMDGDAPK